MRTDGSRPIRWTTGHGRAAVGMGGRARVGSVRLEPEVLRRVVLAASVLMFLAAFGCVTEDGRRTPLTPLELQAGIERLSSPLPGDPVALYRVEVPESGGLRLTVQTAPEGGRFLLSEPFGAAVALTVWDARGGWRVYDLQQGCRVDSMSFPIMDLADVSPAGIVRLLMGRLPTLIDGGRCRVVGSGDSIAKPEGPGECTALIAPDPWRVVRVAGGTGRGFWEVELDQHTASVAGEIHVSWGDGQWAELQLVRLQWDSLTTLPPEPELPWCSVTDE